jgi:AmmeMemoRadiSam system protein B
MPTQGLVRPPAVAGMFYPASARELERQIRSCLDAANLEGTVLPKAVIAPHAGYVYSGPTAGFAFAALARRADEIEKVVILGPAHRVPVRGLALPGALAFDTPLGTVRVDDELAAAIGNLPQVEVSDAAHQLEHSLEVEIPFLQVVLGEFTILPLVVGDASAAEVAEVLDLVWGGPETAIVVSSDLSHYLAYDEARRVDAATVDRMLDLAGPIRPTEACGAYPINGLLEAVRQRGLEAELLDLRNSGDTAGDRRQVVGYTAIAFH